MTPLPLQVELVGLETRPAAGAWTFDCGMRTVQTAFSAEQCRREIQIEPAGPQHIAGYRLNYVLTFPAGAGLRVHHHAMPRLHREMTLSAAQQLGGDGLFRTGFSSPGNFELPAGHQDMAFHNAFVAFQPGGPAWLIGPLTEGAAKAGYRWRLVDDRTLEIMVEFACLGIESWPLAGGQVFAGEVVYEDILTGSVKFGPNIFDGYHAALLQTQALGRIHRGPASRHELFWGSWNEGIYRNIDEELILTEARWVARNLPNVKWIQIDDGFEKDADRHSTPAANLGGHWQDETAWCPRRFPRGMRALADDIRALGLRPMIWFSPSCSIHSDLFKAHPEFFIPNSTLHFEENLVFADFSLTEVRDLARRSLDRLLVEWRFEGVKLDFWTYGFEQPRMKLRRNEQTNLQWLSWLEHEIRMRLPEDGLMLSCLEPANGNPFRSAVWDQHRVGPDITGGLPLATFEEIGVAVAALTGLKQTQRFFWQPNADGLSLYRYGDTTDDAKWRLITTFMAASGAVTELGGRLSHQQADPRMEAFRRIVARVRHGQKVICPGYDWVANEGRAPFLWARLDGDGGGLLGLTNWNESSGTSKVSAESLSKPSGTKLVNLFTGETARLPFTRVLSGGDGELWEILPQGE